MRLEQLKPARFDDAMREQMQQEALNAFLEERVERVLAGDADSLDPDSLRFRVMSEQPTATFEGLLRRYPAFRELGDDRLKWLAPAHVPFIARLAKSYFARIACLSFVSASSKVAAVFSMMILACVGQSPLLMPSPVILSVGLGWCDEVLVSGSQQPLRSS